MNYSLLPATTAVVESHPDRPYQTEAIEAIEREFASGIRSTLLVLATGLGKTHVFCRVAHRQSSRVLILAHRQELLSQAAKRIQSLTGELVDTEMGQQRAGASARIVVGSVQTLQNARRRARWQASDFGLVIVDEAHHATAKSYRSVLAHFPDAKVLGVTATPTRGDKKALGAVFDSVAYEMGLSKGIRQGYLCQVRCWPIYVDTIDLASTRVTAGDLNQGDLDAVMSTEANLHGVARPLLGIGGDNHVGNRKTIVFSGPGVSTAVKLTEVLNRYRPGCARVVHGETDDVTRRSVLTGHERGEFQFLVNVGIATEGYDSPTVECVALARATASVGLLTQMIGRVMRNSPGKEYGLVVDFYGCAARTDLSTPIDVLGGDYPDDVKAAAKAEMKLGAADKSIEEILAKAKETAEKRERERAAREAAEVARRAQVRVEATWRGESPFDLLGASYSPAPTGLRRDSKLAPPSHVELLARHGFKTPRAGWPAAEAASLVALIAERDKSGLASPRQVRMLKMHRIDAQKMKKQLASRLCEALFARHRDTGKWGFAPSEAELIQENYHAKK
jgi:superfamily II DNA or RNA helicase